MAGYMYILGDRVFFFLWVLQVLLALPMLYLLGFAGDFWDAVGNRVFFLHRMRGFVSDLCFNYCGFTKSKVYIIFRG